ncbi:MAG: 50S ribosomal protein L28 [Candidatus Aceula meridiana]|nr:50S ribosomal protein L28 [Candidatus Aceula meridiana]
MAKICEICGKTATAGRRYKRRGMAVRKGGAGQKIVGKSIRTFTPNLQSIRIVLNGGVKKTSVCAKCIKGGKITKAA